MPYRLTTGGGHNPDKAESQNGPILSRLALNRHLRAMPQVPNTKRRPGSTNTPSQPATARIATSQPPIPPIRLG